jgi:hypothetical protein
MAYESKVMIGTPLSAAAADNASQSMHGMQEARKAQITSIETGTVHKRQRIRNS